MRKPPAAVDTTINHPARLFMDDCFRELLNGSWNREVFMQHREECVNLLERIAHLQLSAILRFGSDPLKAKTMMAINGAAEALENIPERRHANKDHAAVPFTKKREKGGAQ